MSGLKEKNTPENKMTLIKFSIYTTFIWIWAWIFGYFWFTNLKYVSFDTTFILFLGPLAVTAIFLLINRHSIKEFGFVGLEK